MKGMAEDTGMDKRTLKSLIVKLREDGKSFQEISDILLAEYDTKMTRQAVYGMYQRASSDEAVKKNMELVLVSNDIITYNILGYTDRQIVDILKESNSNITLKDVEYTIDINEEYSAKVEAEMVKHIAHGFRLGWGLDRIADKWLKYKNRPITPSKLRVLAGKATELLILLETRRVLKDVYNATEDKDLIKCIIAENNIGLSIKDIECDECSIIKLNGNLQIAEEKIV